MTVINVAQALETVRAVVIQITYVIQFLAAFSIFAGIIILASCDRGDAVPADSRGGGAEDAGCDACGESLRCFRSSLRCLGLWQGRWGCCLRI